MNFYYDPLDKYHKSITGGVSTEDVVVLRVIADFPRLTLRLRCDGGGSRVYEMHRKDGVFTAELKTGEPGLYYYRFCGENFISAEYQLTVSVPYKTPDWLKGGLIYQIFPDRFNRVGDPPVKKGRIFHDDLFSDPIWQKNADGEILNNDFFGGNFKGICAKLDYLEALGVTAIYLNPVFEAYSNHRYDTGDYMKFDEMLGGDEDFEELVAAAGKRGMKIILDGVFNHTGADSRYFDKYGNYGGTGAYPDKHSPYRDWYFFDGEGYACWWNIPTLPAVNESCPSYVDFIMGKNGVIERYSAFGIGGWRLDVVDELPDEFITKLRSAIKDRDPDAVIIGEVWEDASDKIAYGVRRKYFQGAELDGVMNYPLKNAIISFVLERNAAPLAALVDEQRDRYPQESLAVCMNVLGTHDTVRIISALGGAPWHDKNALAAYSLNGEEYSRAKKLLRIASLLQYTLIGVPCLYYGDEAGMQGCFDPLNRRFYPWGKEDGELIEWYKLLGRIRKNKAFGGTEYEKIHAQGGVYVYSRGGAVLVAVNCGDDDYRLDFVGELIDLLTGKIYADGADLPAGGLLVLAVK